MTLSLVWFLAHPVQCCRCCRCNRCVHGGVCHFFSGCKLTFWSVKITRLALAQFCTENFVSIHGTVCEILQIPRDCHPNSAVHQNLPFMSKWAQEGNSASSTVDLISAENCPTYTCNICIFSTDIGQWITLFFSIFNTLPKLSFPLSLLAIDYNNSEQKLNLETSLWMFVKTNSKLVSNYLQW